MARAEKEAPPDTGRMGFRYLEEAPYGPDDHRPVLSSRYPLFRNRLEAGIYESAVLANPRKQGEGPMSYAERLCKIVNDDKIEDAVKRFPTGPDGQW